MANLIKHKRSYVTGEVPTSTQVADGEIVINVRDGRAFVKQVSSTGVITIKRLGDPADFLSGTIDSDSISSGSISNSKLASKSVTSDKLADDITIAGVLTVNGNINLGNTNVDILTVGAASVFNSPATFNSTATLNGNTTIGSSSGNILAINATTSFGASVLFAATAFSSKASFNGGVEIQSGDDFTFDGNAYTHSRKFEIQDSAGTVTFGMWGFDTDTTVGN